MPKRFVIQLPRPMPASHDCLPHAAMNLGAPRSAGIQPLGGAVSKLVIEQKMGNWVFYRLDDGGGFVGDSWHGTLDDAAHQARREFGVDLGSAEVSDA